VTQLLREIRFRTGWKAMNYSNSNVFNGYLTDVVEMTEFSVAIIVTLRTFTEPRSFLLPLKPSIQVSIEASSRKLFVHGEEFSLLFRSTSGSSF